MSTITIDDKKYEIDKMSDEEKSLVQAMNYCDAKIAETQNQLAALKTAKQAYVNDLGARLQK
jgi:cell division protein ZapA (FtsZ GTPase activity inhibitor)